jgi:hypothetical protein
MSKAYSSNLTQEQWELLEPLIPAAKTGGERAGGKQVLNKVKQMGNAVSRLNIIWVDGGNEKQPIYVLGDGFLSLDCTSCITIATTQRFCSVT